MREMGGGQRKREVGAVSVFLCEKGRGGGEKEMEERDGDKGRESVGAGGEGGERDRGGRERGKECRGTRRGRR